MRYEVKVAFLDGAQPRRPGESVELSPRQASFLELGGFVALPAPPKTTESMDEAAPAGAGDENQPAAGTAKRKGGK